MFMDQSFPDGEEQLQFRHAILHGDQETGVTIMKMDKGIDTGDIFAIEIIPIEKNDNTKSLSKKLSILGSDLLIEQSLN